MGFSGGVKLTPPQHILVFKYTSRDRVKLTYKVYDQSLKGEHCHLINGFFQFDEPLKILMILPLT